MGLTNQGLSCTHGARQPSWELGAGGWGGGMGLRGPCVCHQGPGQQKHHFQLEAKPPAVALPSQGLRSLWEEKATSRTF